MGGEGEAFDDFLRAMTAPAVADVASLSQRQKGCVKESQWRWRWRGSKGKAVDGTGHDNAYGTRGAGQSRCTCTSCNSFEPRRISSLAIWLFGVSVHRERGSVPNSQESGQPPLSGPRRGPGADNTRQLTPL